MYPFALLEAIRGAWDKVDKLLAEGRGGDMNAIDSKSRYTVLHYAAEAERTSTVLALVAAGASLEPPRSDAERCWTPLMLACRGGHHECVEALVEAGAPLNTILRWTVVYTALICAAETGNLRSVRALLAAGAIATAPNEAWPPLRAAIYGKSAECVKAVLRAGAHADINATYFSGRSPLGLAMSVELSCRSGSFTGGKSNPRLVSILLRAGAPLPAPDDRGLLELRVDAMNEGNLEECEKLFAYLGAVRSAGGIVRYENLRRAPFVAALARCGGFPIPGDTIPIVAAFWVRRALDSYNML